MTNLENPYPKVADKVPLWRKLLARIGIPTIVYWDKEHFSAPTPIYVAWCKLHRIYFLDYPHGYFGFLDCPQCLGLIDEVLKQVRKEEEVNQS